MKSKKVLIVEESKDKNDIPTTDIQEFPVGAPDEESPPKRLCLDPHFVHFESHHAKLIKYIQTCYLLHRDTEVIDVVIYRQSSMRDKCSSSSLDVFSLIRYYNLNASPPKSI